MPFNVNTIDQVVLVYENIIRSEAEIPLYKALEAKGYHSLFDVNFERLVQLVGW